MQGKMGSGSPQHMTPDEMMMTDKQMQTAMAEHKRTSKSGVHAAKKSK